MNRPSGVSSVGVSGERITKRLPGTAPGYLRLVLVRFAGAVMLTTGLLLIADCGLTLVWREPVTSFLASRDQAQLRHELDEQTTRREPHAASVQTLAMQARKHARTGHAIGRIEIPSLDRSYVMVQGTRTSDLRRGPGHYPTTPFPGENALTVAVAGHRTTYLAPFRTVDNLKRGASIVLAMPYATLKYAVTGKRAVLPTQTDVLAAAGHPQLVLTTCDPPYSASHRLVIFARLVSAERA
jgi:sortase A